MISFLKDLPFKLLSSMPLLEKELREQAARKRTYATRSILLCGMALATPMIIPTTFRFQGGRELFLVILLLESAAIFAIAPCVMGMLIASEKEGCSLELLFTTRLSPNSIIIQKYLSRIIPMLMLFILGLPFIAIAYSMGGIDPSMLWLPTILALALCYIGAFSLLMSCVFSSSAEAIVASYIGLAMQAAAIFLAVLLLAHNAYYPHIFNHPELFWTTLTSTGTIVCLILSCIILKRRPMRRKGNMLLARLEKLDRFWKRINSIFGGIEILKSDTEMKRDEGPLQWQERAKTPSGRLIYKIRLSLLLLAAAFTLSFLMQGSIMELTVVIFMLGTCAALAHLAAASVSAISGERKSRTLDIILASPISAKELVRMRMKRAWSCIGIWILPLLMVAFCIAYSDFSRREASNPCSYFFCIICIALLQMPLLAWICCWIGLATKSHAKAIVISMSLLAAWNLLPLILASFTHTWKDSVTLCLCPLGMLAQPPNFNSPIYLTLLLFPASALVVRHYCLSRADSMLRK